jgi:endogenous inhibitor of DNA gyrase (YacG/DUF329 family)
MIRPRECPICRKSVLPPADEKRDFFPFCSERCRQIDLLRWSKGHYAIVEHLTNEQMQEKAGEGEASLDDSEDS